MFDTSAAGHDFNIDNGTFVVDASANRVGIGTATPSTLLDVNGALTATTIAGTLTTAAQTNITSVGTLTGLVVNGNASIQTGALTLSGANPPLSISNSGDAKVNFVRSSNTINYAMSSSASGGHGFYDNAASDYDLYMKAGKVGIGTTSPYKKLEVTGDIQLDASNANIWLKSGATGTNGFINWTFNTNDSVFNKIGMDYDTRATTGFHIDAGYPITIDATAAGGKAINFDISGSTKAVIDGTGNVGIGTSGPTQKLDVRGGTGAGTITHAIFTGTSSRGLEIRTRSDTSGGQNSGTAEINSADSEGTGGDLAFSSNGNVKMFIDGGGNVGIGTTSPTAHLSVTNGGFSFDSTTGIPAIRAEGSYGGAIGLLDTKEAGWYAMNSGDTLHQYVGRTPGSNAPNANIVMTYLSSGSVGVGVSPSGTYKLQVNGGISLSAKSLIDNSAYFISGTNGFRWNNSTDAYNNCIMYDNGNMYIRGGLGINSAPITGTQVYIKKLDANNNLMRWGEGSGQNQYRFRIDQNFEFIANSGSGDNITLSSANGNITAAQYNTPSDERLKENIAYADDAGSKIDSIQVRKFNWIADGSHQDYGMVAQELNEIAPEAVSVPDDPEKMMGVDYSKLVPMLVKEIQSLRTRVTELEEDK